MRYLGCVQARLEYMYLQVGDDEWRAADSANLIRFLEHRKNVLKQCRSMLDKMACVKFNTPPRVKGGDMHTKIAS